MSLTGASLWLFNYIIMSALKQSKGEWFHLNLTALSKRKGAPSRRALSQARKLLTEAQDALGITFVTYQHSGHPCKIVVAHNDWLGDIPSDMWPLFFTKDGNPRNLKLWCHGIPLGDYIEQCADSAPHNSSSSSFLKKEKIQQQLSAYAESENTNQPSEVSPLRKENEENSIIPDAATPYRKDENEDSTLRTLPLPPVRRKKRTILTTRERRLVGDIVSVIEEDIPSGQPYGIQKNALWMVVSAAVLMGHQRFSIVTAFAEAIDTGARIATDPKRKSKNIDFGLPIHLARKSLGIESPKNDEAMGVFKNNPTLDFEMIRDIVNHTQKYIDRDPEYIVKRWPYFIQRNGDAGVIEVYGRLTDLERKKLISITKNLNK